MRLAAIAIVVLAGAIMWAGAVVALGLADMNHEGLNPKVYHIALADDAASFGGVVLCFGLLMFVIEWLRGFRPNRTAAESSELRALSVAR